MPRNSRPGGIFGDLDYRWKDTTLSERVQAQNVWDLLYEQEKANILSEEKIKQDNKLIELYHEILDTLSTDSYNDTSIEVLNSKQQICNNINIDYEDIKQFEEILNKGNLKLFNTYYNLKKDVQNLHKEKENALEKIEWKYFFKSDHEGKNVSQLLKQEKQQFLENNEFDLQIKEKENECSKVLLQLQDKILQQHKNLYEFRLTHYNSQIELLFKKLNLPVQSIETKILSNGSIDDFKQYISDIIIKEG